MYITKVIIAQHRHLINVKGIFTISNARGRVFAAGIIAEYKLRIVSIGINFVETGDVMK